MQIVPWRLRSALNKFFTKFFTKYTWALSQAGQDQWVFGETFNEQTKGFFLDIGAHDGITISNTYVLERRYKWSGLCIEANPITFDVLRRNRSAICVNACLDNKESEVEFALRGMSGGIVSPDLDNAVSRTNDAVIRVKTALLINILREHAAPPIIDYLSIDVEGAEERILDSFDFEQYRFNCITIERPSGHLRSIFAKQGYVLVKEIHGLDCFYVHRKYLDDYNRNLFAFYAKKTFCRPMVVT